MIKPALTAFLFLAIFSAILFIGTISAQPMAPHQDRKLKDVNMELKINSEEKQKIDKSIKEKYGKVAVSPEGQFRYPTGQAGLRALRYDPKILRSLPEAVAAAYCGVGNPFSLGPISNGETVLDVGCGAGVDVILAA